MIAPGKVGQRKVLHQKAGSLIVKCTVTVIPDLESGAQ